MSAGDVTLLRVSDDEQLDDLLERIHRHAGEDLILELGESVDALASAGEFHVLSKAANQAQVRLRVETNEPIRLELARIYGLAERDSDLVPRAGRSSAPPDAPTEPAIVAADTRPTLQPDRETTREIGDSDDDRPVDSPAHDFDEGSFSFVISPPVPRRPEIADPAPWDVPTPGVRPRRSRIAPLLIFGVLAVLIGIAILLAGIIAPWLRVSIVPASETISQEITFGIAGATDGLDVAIEARTISHTVETEITVPTSGVRVEPDASAAGTVQLTNSSTSERVVPAGTYFPGPGAVGFLTTEDVVVPAADPFGTLTFGSATVGIVAELPGVAGNVDAGDIAGQLDDDLFFTNRAPTSGGTMREVAVVDEADIAEAQRLAEAELNERALVVIHEQLDEGEQLLPNSIETGEITHEVSHQAGSDATEITTRSRLEVKAKAYRPAELEAAGREAIQQRLAASVPEGFALQASTLEVLQPETIEGVELPAYGMSASATVTKIIEEEDLQELERQLVGADADDIDTILSGWEDAERVEVERGPSWLPWDAPVRLESRVEIDVEQPETESP